MSFPVKICGITRIEDALHAERLGAFAVGFIFFRKSPRYIDPEAAGRVSRALGPRIARIGVFVDEEPDEVRRIASVVALTSVQLHGDEPPEYLRKLSGTEVIKAFRVGRDFEPGHLSRYPAGWFLLDTFVPGVGGGTGKTFDWSLARPCREYGRVILAGGLHAGNLREAVQIAAPWGVDVSSGVEVSPGVKDHEKMDALFQALEKNSEHL